MDTAGFIGEEFLGRLNKMAGRARVFNIVNNTLCWGYDGTHFGTIVQYRAPNGCVTEDPSFSRSFCCLILADFCNIDLRVEI